MKNGPNLLKTNSRTLTSDITNQGSITNYWCELLKRLLLCYTGLILNVISWILVYFRSHSWVLVNISDQTQIFLRKNLQNLWLTDSILVSTGVGRLAELQHSTFLPAWLMDFLLQWLSCSCIVWPDSGQTQALEKTEHHLDLTVQHTHTQTRIHIQTGSGF